MDYVNLMVNYIFGNYPRSENAMLDRFCQVLQFYHCILHSSLHGKKIHVDVLGLRQITQL